MSSFVFLRFAIPLIQSRECCIAGVCRQRQTADRRCPPQSSAQSPAGARIRRFEARDTSPGMQPLAPAGGPDSSLGQASAQCRRCAPLQHRAANGSPPATLGVESSGGCVIPSAPECVRRSSHWPALWRFAVARLHGESYDLRTHPVRPAEGEFANCCWASMEASALQPTWLAHRIIARGSRCSSTKFLMVASHRARTSSA
jgi:hypothetical protein